MPVDLTRVRELVGNVRSDFAVLVVVGVAVGIGSGVAGLLLHLGLAHLDLEQGLDRATGFGRVLAVLLPALGAGLSWTFLHRWMHAREEGLGEVIWSAHREGGRMPKTGVFTQMLASWLTVGSGGSAGPEAPVAYSGAAIGSTVATWLGLTERRRITLLGCGVAGAISAIFNAPVTGMLFALEIVLGEWVSFNILPIAISSVVANVFAGTMRPGAPIFHFEGIDRIGYADYGLVIGLALLTGLAASVLLRSIRLVSRVFRRSSRPRLWKPVAGGLLVGLLGLGFPAILGEGYAGIQETFTGSAGKVASFFLLLALLKVVATSLTLGSGGCGGIFAPALFIGAYLGLFYHEVLRGSGAIGATAAAHAGVYALIGMAGMLVGTLHAPLSAVFLVAEITHNYNLLLPLILVVACAGMVAQCVESTGLYGKEVEEAHGSLRAIDLDARILADLSLAEVVVAPDVVLHEDQPLDEVHADVQKSDHDLFPVVDARGRHAGILRAHLLLGHDPAMHRALLVSDVMDASWPAVQADTPIADVLPLLDEVAVVPVVGTDGRLAGFVSSRKLLLRYRQELLIQTSR